MTWIGDTLIVCILVFRDYDDKVFPEEQLLEVSNSIKLIFSGKYSFHIVTLISAIRDLMTLKSAVKNTLYLVIPWTFGERKSSY